MNSKIYFKRFLVGDFYIVGMIIILAVFSIMIFAFADYDGAKAVVMRHGSVMYEIDLGSVTERIELETISTFNEVIVVEDGKIRFEKSECPDQVCVRTGWISRPGQVAVCLPAGIIIKIVGEEKNDDVDILLK